jgi:endogenous inhibitor of DNA gyrase (YacG/DUF329 family)
MVQVERSMPQLEPYANNTKCEHCKKMFYVNQEKSRGSPRRFCSLRCRNADYFERRAKKYKNFQDETQSLYLTIAKLKKELDQVKMELAEANKKLAFKPEAPPAKPTQKKPRAKVAT